MWSNWRNMNNGPNMSPLEVSVLLSPTWKYSLSEIWRNQMLDVFLSVELLHLLAWVRHRKCLSRMSFRDSLSFSHVGKSTHRALAILARSNLKLLISLQLSYRDKPALSALRQTPCYQKHLSSSRCLHIQDVARNLCYCTSGHRSRRS